MSNHLQTDPSAAMGHRRARSGSRAQLESGLHAIQQGNENLAAMTGAFVPGTGGFIGGPPATDDPTSPVGATGLHHRTSIRHKKDTTLYTLNGKRVRTTDRICTDVTPPAGFVPSEPQFWDNTDPVPKPSLSFLKTHFYNEGRLSETQALYILNAATQLFKKEHNMLSVGDGVTVCGDIHGQYYDLLKLFEVGGDPADTPYLFLGDYVDRGAFGIECLLYLYAHKIHYPRTFILLRGNHECRHLTKYFTFANECIRKYSTKVYEACLASFNALPIAALMDERFLCVHGGLSPDVRTLADIQAIDRFKEPPTEGALCDILWSDPIETFSRPPEPNDPPPVRVRRHANRKGKAPARGNDPADEGDLLPVGFTHNHIRGCSYFYDYKAVTAFLERNRLISLIRGHEVQDKGFRMYRSTSLNFPALITVFSAPNYLDVHHNRAAVIKYITHNITIRQFNGQPHPYTLPGTLNAFSWSLPFVAAKITEMLLAILNIYSKEELEEEEEEMIEEEAELGGEEFRTERHNAIKNKILSVGRMARIFELLRDESEGASELAYTPSPTSRDSRLNIQNQRLSRSVTSFEEARKLDLANERLPVIPPQEIYRARSPIGVRSAGSGISANIGTADAISTAGSAYSHAPSDEDYAHAGSLSYRHRTEEDTNAMIKRTLEGRDDAEGERELMELAARLSKPLIGRDVKRAYGARVATPGVLKRTETA